MSTGGNVEGYLFKIGADTAVEIVYCILDEGILQYFSRKGGELLGAVPLTGSKVDVFILPSDKDNVANQFRVDAQPRPPVARNGSPTRPKAQQQPQQQRAKVSVTFAGSTKELSDQWAVSILNWNRYSWEDPQTLCASKDEFATLNEILHPSAQTKRPDNFVPIGVSRAVQPI